jgi:hypothetical protein
VPPDDITMLEQIEELLRAPATGSGAPTLARMEDTLTEGYAQALALEAERGRLERRLGEAAREVNGDGGPDRAELAALASRIHYADGELSRLRDLLGTLHDRAREARKATPSSL